MNGLKLRLANIAFRLYVAEEKKRKHWKTQDEVYTMSEWQKYLDNSKNRAPKFTPILVPDEIDLGEKKDMEENVKNRIEELTKKGKNKFQISKILKKEFADKNLQKEGKKMLKKKEDEVKEHNEQKRQERNEKKRKQRAEHHSNVVRLREENKFAWQAGSKTKEITKRKTRFVGRGESIYNETFINPPENPVKNKLSEDEQEQLKNQLLQFHKERPKVNRRRKTDKQLRDEFISKMNPAGYSNPKAYNEAKERIQQMDPHEFMAMVHSIFQDDEDEQTITKPVSKGNDSGKEVVEQDLSGFNY